MAGSSRPKRKAPPPGWKALDNKETEAEQERQRAERRLAEEARNKRSKNGQDTDKASSTSDSDQHPKTVADKDQDKVGTKLASHDLMLVPRSNPMRLGIRVKE